MELLNECQWVKRKVVKNTKTICPTKLGSVIRDGSARGVGVGEDQRGNKELL